MSYKVIRLTGFALFILWSIALIYDMANANASNAILDIAMMLMAGYTAKG